MKKKRGENTETIFLLPDFQMHTTYDLAKDNTRRPWKSENEGK